MQIFKSPQACAFFKKCCTETGVTFMELLMCIWTCWALLFKMLEWMLWLCKVFSFFIYKMHVSWLKYHLGVNRLIQLADKSNEVPDLKGKSYVAFKLLPQEWTIMELMQDVLQVWCATTLFLTPTNHLNFRSLPQLSRHFQATCNQLYFTLSLSSNSFRNSGEIWLHLQSMQISLIP